ncbi:VOC family protein [Aestuariispira insulae]|uniref:Glyoxalase-like protein n=1 Tax=Aestuariispira insulae TaxID=1461337 RepID=A0A3D9HX48_9PROT|nr:VOC family protein [Aestuariispira insulae]RED53989.1 glyoxalase-like protein [Aestuariispira insulae]
MSSKTAIAGIDHSIIGVRDLEAARETYLKLGFTVTRRGRHIGWGTANYCIMFGPDYLEILGIVDPTQFDAGLNDFIRIREGFLKLVLRSDDADMTARHLKAAGFDMQPVQDLARLLEMPEGDVKPAFKLMHPKDGNLPGFSGFLCQHLTPDLVWRPEWMAHENGAKAVHAYVILHQDPESLAAVYESFFQEPVVRQPGRLIVETGGGKLVFIHPDQMDQLYPGLEWVGPLEDGTILAASIAVEDTDRTEAVLSCNGVGHLRHGDGSILVQPGNTHGIALAFQAL